MSSEQAHHDPLGVRSMMTVREVAEYLHCHQETVRRMIARGELQAISLGSRHRITPESFDAYIKRGGSSNGSHGE